jgi:hypothetical protein
MSLLLTNAAAASFTASLLTTATTGGDLHNTVRAKDRSARSAVLQGLPTIPQNSSQQQVVVAARKAASPPAFRSRMYSVDNRRVKPAIGSAPLLQVDSNGDGSPRAARTDTAASSTRWTSEHSDAAASAASDAGAVVAAGLAREPAAARTSRTSTSGTAAAGTTTVMGTADMMGADSETAAAERQGAVFAVARRSTLNNKVVDFHDTEKGQVF